MFDRFTENARRVMQHASQTAQQLGSSAIETDHVLIGLLEPATSNAHKMLDRLDVETTDLLQAMRRLLPATGEPTTEPLPFAEATKTALATAMRMASERGDNHIGSQHLLLALAHQTDDHSANILAKAGASWPALTGVLAETMPRHERADLRLLLISNSTMHGGGYLEHCRDQLVEILGGSRREVLFVPYALADHDTYADKARAAFESMGHGLLSIHEVTDKVGAIAEAEALFVGGGNTFRLLQSMIHHELVPAIQKRAFAGMPYIGSSAGTNVATLSIRTTNDMPIVRPPTFTALQLVPFQINPHYLDPAPDSRHMGETREERIRQFHEEHSEPVLGLREGCMLRVEGAAMQLLGSTDARLFRRGEEPVEYSPPCDLSFLMKD